MDIPKMPKWQMVLEMAAQVDLKKRLVISFSPFYLDLFGMIVQIDGRVSWSLDNPIGCAFQLAFGWWPWLQSPTWWMIAYANFRHLRWWLRCTSYFETRKSTPFGGCLSHFESEWPFSLMVNSAYFFLWFQPLHFLGSMMKYDIIDIYDN